MKLTRNFYSRDTKDVAKELLGMVLVHGYFSGYITETEAYIGTEDKASHASWRKKETCFPMWGPAGFTYVYFTYGMHHMLNIVTEQPELPAAVLIRSLEPVTGIDTMIKNRNTENVQNLTTGPGKLTQALEIDKSHNNIDITESDIIYITNEGALENFGIVTATRIGIDYAEEHKDKFWRYYIKDNPFVSRT